VTAVNAGRSLTAPFVLVWAGDPALDFPTEAEDPEAFASAKAIWQEYLADGDYGRLPVKPGMSLALFTCKPLPLRVRAAFRDRISSAVNSEGDKAAAAGIWVDVFAASVRSWSGGFMAGAPPATLKKGPGAGGEVLSESSMDNLHLPVVMALGPRIFELASLGP
jgi:hypothetical protein